MFLRFSDPFCSFPTFLLRRGDGRPHAILVAPPPSRAAHWAAFAVPRKERTMAGAPRRTAETQERTQRAARPHEHIEHDSRVVFSPGSENERAKKKTIDPTVASALWPTGEGNRVAPRQYCFNFVSFCTEKPVDAVEEIFTELTCSLHCFVFLAHIIFSCSCESKPTNQAAVNSQNSQHCVRL